MGQIKGDKSMKNPYPFLNPIKRKYKNKKVQIDGMIFDSEKEANRYKELEALEKAGLISDLQRQVKYSLIPAQREPDIIGKKGGIKKGRIIERECAYFADFVYWDESEQKKVVEDVKGYKGGGAYEIFKIKRKLMLHLYGIRVSEI